MTLETIAPLSDDPTISFQAIASCPARLLPANAVTRRQLHHARDTIGGRTIPQAPSVLLRIRPSSMAAIAMSGVGLMPMQSRSADGSIVSWLFQERPSRSLDAVSFSEWGCMFPRLDCRESLRSLKLFIARRNPDIFDELGSLGSSNPHPPSLSLFRPIALLAGYLQRENFDFTQHRL
jgi:hypothetical protein